MARTRAPQRVSATRAGRITTAVAVVALAAAVGVLSVLALGTTRPESRGTADPVPSFSFPARSGTPGPATPAPTPAATGANPTTAPGAAERFLTVGQDTIWRATAGACRSTAPRIERSNDNGDTWQNVTPASPSVVQVRELSAITAQAASTVADVGASCQTSTLRTYTDGQFWEPYPDIFTTDTYLTADGSVVLAGRTVTAPCADPWGLRSAADGTAALICDGTAYLREDDSWSPVIAAARAVAVASGGTLVVAHTADGCHGTLITAYEPDPREVGCVDTTEDAPGAVAIDVVGAAVTLWTGSRLIDVE